MENEGVIDREVLDNLLEAVGGDGDFLAELLETYFADTPELFATMQAALENQDADEFRRAAHTLKSNSANFGAMDLSKQAKAMEDMGKSGDLAQASENLKKAETEYKKVKSALEMIQKNG